MCVKMVTCRINIFGLYAVLCLMTIYGADVRGADCEEYVVVFKEIICPKTYRITSVKPEEINWDNVNYPCNSTNKDLGKKCLIDFDCLGVERNCKKHIIPTNFQNHSFIAENHSAKLVVTTEAGLVPLVPTTTVNNTATSIISTTEALDVAKRSVTGEEKPQHKIVDYNPTTYDVNIIYINDNDNRNNSKKINEPDKRDKTVECEYAEIVCLDDGKPESYNLSHHYKPPETLKIEINRDLNSAIQPLFTGYFPESSNDTSTNYNDNFSHQKAMLTSCSIKNDTNCKQNIESLKHINLYFNTNYIENNTMTMYPNCTKQSNTSEDTLIVKCEDVSFAKHNTHILQAPPKKELWYCQIMEYRNSLISTEQRSDNSRAHFIDCSNETKLVNHKNKSVDLNVTATSDSKDISGKELTNLNVSSQINPKNMITIHIAHKPNNCSDQPSIILNEGKIIDLGLNNKTEKIILNNNVDLILTSCMKDPFLKINNKAPPPNTELTIILKNESLNTSDLKQFNGTVKKDIAKQRILLRCDHTNLDLNDNSTSNLTQLQCESIDLDLYNITGIEITPSSQIANKEPPIKSTRQKPKTWNCLITEKHQKNRVHFENCSNDVNISYSKNKSVTINISLDSDDANKSITITNPKDDIKINGTEIPTGKMGENKDNLSKHTIKISMSENASICSNNSSLNVDKGKVVDFGEHNKEEIQNIELKLTNCINVKSSTINETKTDSKVDLTIILKSKALNASDLEQFNGTLKEGNETQRILLRCDHPSISTTSNMTVLQCESLDLDLNNITGIEISEKSNQLSNGNNTKEKKKENLKHEDDSDSKIEEKVNKNGNFSTNQTVENNTNTVNNKSDESKDIQKNLSESKEILKNQNFNRRKDIPTGSGQNSLAIKSAETEKIMLIALLSIAGGAILIVILLRTCTKKKEYDLAPTREPPDNDETAL